MPEPTVPTGPMRDEPLVVVAAEALRSGPIRELARRRDVARLSREGALMLGYLAGFAAGARWGLASDPDRRWSGS